MMSTIAVMAGVRCCIRCAPLVANAGGRAKPGRIGRVPWRALMPYVDRVLQEGESVRHIARISWVTYLPGLFLWAVAGLLAGILPRDQSFLHYVILFVAIVLFVIGAILLARAWFHRFTTEIAVTDRRIIYKRGFIRRYTVEMHMDKVESVDVDQSILGRMLDYGDVIIHGTGMGLEPLPNIDHPLELRNHITAV
jgi:Bacterial PH domain